MICEKECISLKYIEKLLILFLIAALMAGCAAEPVQTTPPTQITTEPPTVPPTDPPTQPPTDPPTEEPTEEPTDPVEAMMTADDYQTLLSRDGGDYFRALGTIFNTPEDVDLYYFFYGGVDCPARWDELDSAERDYLLAQGLWDELDLQKMPAALLEEQLQQYFGIGLADMKIPERWVYYADADSYYTNHSDAWLPFASVTDAEEFPDGTVRLYLTVDMVLDHTGEYVADAETVLTLRKTDGGYRIVTHVFAQDVV